VRRNDKGFDMKLDLTNAERRLLVAIEYGNPWTSIGTELSIMVPAAIILGLGVYYESGFACMAGFGTYAISQMIRSYKNSRWLCVYQSQIVKLRRVADDYENAPCPASPVADSTGTPVQTETL